MSSFLNFMKGALSGLLFYLLGKERAQRRQTEEALKLQQTYAKLDEKNKHYRDAGKSGLLKRLHDKPNTPKS